jgi:hypothetical protein
MTHIAWAYNKTWDVGDARPSSNDAQVQNKALTKLKGYESWDIKVMGK